MTSLYMYMYVSVLIIHCSGHNFSYRLNIQVEFQNPNKEPIPIFLDDVSQDNTISVLSARVSVYVLVTCIYSNAV